MSLAFITSLVNYEDTQRLVYANHHPPAVCKTRIRSRSAALQPLVLAFGDLQIEGGAFTINHNRSGVQQLLTCAIVRGKAAHHAE